MQDAEGVGIKAPKKYNRQSHASFSSFAVNRPWIRGFIFFAFFLGLSIGAIFVVKNYLFSSPPVDKEEQTNLQPHENIGEYQAIFLDNGQVYFGKLVRREGDFYRLEDVFYFKQNSQTPGAAKDQNQDVSLSKLGSEVHGPEDFMEINRDHIIFIEDLQDDSKIVKAITEYKSQDGKVVK